MAFCTQTTLAHQQAEKQYDEEFTTLLNKVKNKKVRVGLDDKFRRLYVRTKTASVAVDKLHDVKKRLDDAELNQSWTDLADAVNNALGIIIAQIELAK